MFEPYRDKLVTALARARQKYAVESAARAAQLTDLDAKARHAKDEADRARLSYAQKGFQFELFVANCERELRQSADPRIPATIRALSLVQNRLRASAVGAGFHEVMTTHEGGVITISRTPAVSAEKIAASLKTALHELEELALAAASDREIGDRLAKIRNNLVLNSDLKTFLDELERRVIDVPVAAE